MNLMLRKWIGLIAAFLFLNTGFVQASATPIICDQEYTLCTSARCIPMPGNPAKAVCDCVVEKGKSAGYKTCKERKPIRDRYKVTSLVSTFSFEQFAFKRKMNCSEGLPWTNCLDMPCTVDPQNSKRALCLCTIENTQAFFTFGGDCNTNTCATGFWSGATQENSIILRKALMQEMRLKPKALLKDCSAK
ncbi:TPA: hypothetical protein JBE46_08065 [Legionella pneumophila subsp. pneumophila]|uniref:Uncharacterized protein n=1 Tax=Legionella pneumophila TaxID=446 RepID=A0A378KLG4_LEGPN|nr:hypothetical protein [Legionella pneumophila]MDC8031104.1 hypothetical protein [Legionella pneumophila subsp. pneumophila]MDW8870396.1 hypothetical protein [Legionella pneumophila]MDW8901071.1 hypothetical protein [Legionella pneumophila]MDW8906143.1 hypothetical protein [Legionella pneumophila]MDW8916500.1 hypothetical protein [Legionella pneumophila]